MATFEGENTFFRYLKYRQIWPIGPAIGVSKRILVVKYVMCVLTL